MNPRFLLAAFPAWLLWLLVVERAFLPSAGRWLFDTRALVWSNDDKVVELEFFADRTPAHMLHGLWRGAPPDPHLGEHYNLLPKLALLTLRQILPAIPAYNLLLLLSALANCLAAALLAMRMSQDGWAAFWAGAMFGAAPLLLRVMAFCSLDFAMAFWTPLFLLGLLAVADRPSVVRVLATGLALFALGLTNFYYLLATVPVTLALLLAFWRWPLPRRSWLGLFLALAAGGLLLAPLLRVELAAIALAHGQSLPGLGLESRPAAPNLQAVREFWALDAWLALVTPLALLGLMRRARRGTLLLLLACALAWGALMVDFRLDRWLFAPLARQVGFLWRARRLELSLVVPLLLLACAGAVGLAELRARLPGRAAVWPTTVALLLAAWVTGPGHDRETFVASYDPLHIPDSLLQRLPHNGERLVLDANARGQMVQLASFYLQQWSGQFVLPADDPLATSLADLLLDPPQAEGAIRPLALEPGEILTRLMGGCVAVLLREAPARSRRVREGDEDSHLPPSVARWQALGMEVTRAGGWALGLSPGCHGGPLTGAR